MEPLEVVLKKIGGLERDLDAEVVVKVYTPPHEDSDLAAAHGNWSNLGHTHIVSRTPDIQKREAARTGLQPIYDYSGWYSARFEAGVLLGERVDEAFQGWMAELREGLVATKSVRHTVYQDTGEMMVDPHGGCTSVDRGFVPVTKPVETSRPVPDEERRATAKKDLLFMYHNLPDRDYRIEAGRALGYSPLRIWAHEHPVAAAAAGIAAIVTALGYGLIGYMSK